MGKQACCVCDRIPSPYRDRSQDDDFLELYNKERGLSHNVGAFHFYEASRCEEAEYVNPLKGPGQNSPIRCRTVESWCCTWDGKGFLTKRQVKEPFKKPKVGIVEEGDEKPQDPK